MEYLKKCKNSRKIATFLECVNLFSNFFRFSQFFENNVNKIFICISVKFSKIGKREKTLIEFENKFRHYENLSP